MGKSCFLDTFQYITIGEMILVNVHVQSGRTIVLQGIIRNTTIHHYPETLIFLDREVLISQIIRYFEECIGSRIVGCP